MIESLLTLGVWIHELRTPWVLLLIFMSAAVALDKRFRDAILRVAVVFVIFGISCASYILTDVTFFPDQSGSAGRVMSGVSGLLCPVLSYTMWGLFRTFMRWDAEDV